MLPKQTIAIINLLNSTVEYTNNLIYLLKDRFSFVQEIHDSEKLNSKIVSLLIASFSCFSIYGAIIGATNTNTPLQILASAIKLPALYLVTLIVCLPTLYIFNAFFGSRSTIAQHWAYLLSTITVIAVLLCGFAPVSLFFLLTVNDKFFFLLLNLAIFTLTGVLGVSFLYQAMKPAAAEEQVGNTQIRTNILKFWLALYGFVGTQLGWTLRPFFGTGKTFELFRPREGSFFNAVWESIQRFMN
jgi:hypothetical protein